MSTITIEQSEHRHGTINDDAHVQFPIVVTIDGEPHCIMNDDAFDAVSQLCDVICAIVGDGDDTAIARAVDTFMQITDNAYVNNNG